MPTTTRCKPVEPDWVAIGIHRFDKGRTITMQELESDIRTMLQDLHQAQEQTVEAIIDLAKARKVEAKCRRGLDALLATWEAKYKEPRHV